MDKRAEYANNQQIWGDFTTMLGNAIKKIIKALRQNADLAVAALNDLCHI